MVPGGLSSLYSGGILSVNGDGTSWYQSGLLWVLRRLESHSKAIVVDGEGNGDGDEDEGGYRVKGNVVIWDRPGWEYARCDV